MISINGSIVQRDCPTHQASPHRLHRLHRLSLPFRILHHPPLYYKQWTRFRPSSPSLPSSKTSVLTLRFPPSLSMRKRKAKAKVDAVLSLERRINCEPVTSFGIFLNDAHASVQRPLCHTITSTSFHHNFMGRISLCAACSRVTSRVADLPTTRLFLFLFCLILFCVVQQCCKSMSYTLANVPLIYYLGPNYSETIFGLVERSGYVFDKHRHYRCAKPQHV